MHDVILCLIQQSLLPCMEVHDIIFMSDTTSITTMEVHVTAQCVDGSALFDPDRFTGGQ